MALQQICTIGIHYNCIFYIRSIFDLLTLFLDDIFVITLDRDRRLIMEVFPLPLRVVRVGFAQGIGMIPCRILHMDFIADYDSLKLCKLCIFKILQLECNRPTVIAYRRRFKVAPDPITIDPFVRVVLGVP